MSGRSPPTCLFRSKTPCTMAEPANSSPGSTDRTDRSDYTSSAVSGYGISPSGTATAAKSSAKSYPTPEDYSKAYYSRVGILQQCVLQQGIQQQGLLGQGILQQGVCQQGILRQGILQKYTGCRGHVLIVVIVVTLSAFL